MSSSSSPSKRIAVNMVTGFLGSGKTTAIRHLMQAKPVGERWGVLVNEFGDVGLDGAVLGSGQSSDVIEVPGGCACCTANLPMVEGLKLLIKQGVDRILVEPTGAGHPARILDMLRAERMKPVLEVRATIALVDPRRWDDPRTFELPTFQDQINLADVLVATKTDLAGEALTQEFTGWASKLFPPKLMVAQASHGALNPTWLDLQPFYDYAPQYPDAHSLPEADEHEHDHHHHHEHNHGEEASEAAPTPGQPIRQESHGLGHHGCGWRFHPEEAFDEASVLRVLKGIEGAERIKGVFHIGKNRWMHMDGMQGQPLAVEPIAWRRDSRLEVLSIGQPLDWDAIEAGLMAARLQPA